MTFSRANNAFRNSGTAAGRRWIQGLVMSGLGLLLLVPGGQLRAQSQGQKVAQKLSQNQQKLRAYSWTKRTEVLVEGQPVTRLVKVRYDIDGKLQGTALGASGDLTPEIRGLVRDLEDRGFAYTQPDPKAFAVFLQRSEIWEGRGSGTIRVEGENFLQSGDSVELTGSGHRLEKAEVETSYRAAPLQIKADYRALPNNGPTYVARLIVSYPSQGLELKIENFDYFSSAQASAPSPPAPAPQPSHSAAAVTSAPRPGTLPAGTEFQVRLVQALTSAKNKAGESFRTVLDKDVVVNGVAVLKRGADVTGTVIEAKHSGRVRGKGKMVLTLSSFQAGQQSVAIQTNTLTFESEGSKGRDAKRIAAAVGAGAGIGAIADGGDGAAKGAVIGTAVGVGATLLTRGKDVEFGAEQKFSFKLENSVKLPAGSRPAPAQASPEQAAKQQQAQAQLASFKQASAENNKKLAQYTWKQKVEVLKGGDVKKTMIYQVGIGPDGKQHKTEIAQPGGDQKKKRRGGRRLQKKIAQKVDELKDYAERMMSLVGHYAKPDPSRLQEQFKAGKGSMTMGPGEGIVNLTVADVYKPEDTMTVSIDKTVQAIRKLTASSYLDGPEDAVELSINFYNNLPDGTNYLGLMTVDGKKEKLTLKVQSYEHTRK